MDLTVKLSRAVAVLSLIVAPALAAQQERPVQRVATIVSVATEEYGKGIDEKGHDYFLQVTDARSDTGGLSGATPAEAVSWGKVDPDKLPDAVVAYIDSTVALPIITAYALARHEPRKPKRLYGRREEFMNLLMKEYEKSTRR